jgi:hypothetical protein
MRPACGRLSFHGRCADEGRVGQGRPIDMIVAAPMIRYGLPDRGDR